MPLLFQPRIVTRGGHRLASHCLRQPAALLPRTQGAILCRNVGARACFSTSQPKALRKDDGTGPWAVEQGEEPPAILKQKPQFREREPEISVASDSAELVKPFTPGALEKARHFGMLFDCDGVLYAGNQKITGAKAALKTVKHHQIRYFFLTNGGGTSLEAAKGADLQRRIQTSEEDDIFAGHRVIQSHTPFLGWPQHVKEEETIFITSSDPKKARAVAKAYGFKNVVTSADLLAHDEGLYPFDPLRAKTLEDGEVKPLPEGITIFKSNDPTSYDTEALKRNNNLRIDHVLIWNDPRDWSLDTQIVHDILISHQGYLGTVSQKNGDARLPNNGWQQDGQPKLWMSNLDLVWRTQYHINRFGTGAFLEAFKGVWAAVTGGKELQYEYMGKPSTLTYDYAHGRLLKDDGGEKPHHRPLKRVYMVGDNPESDIRGAVEYEPEDGTEYVPILVRTGVWQQTEREPVPTWQPAVIVDDVLDAVVWALRNEGIDTDRESLQLELP